MLGGSPTSADSWILKHSFQGQLIVTVVSYMKLWCKHLNANTPLIILQISLYLWQQPWKSHSLWTPGWERKLLYCSICRMFMSLTFDQTCWRSLVLSVRRSRRDVSTFSINSYTGPVHSKGVSNLFNLKPSQCSTKHRTLAPNHL